MRLVLRGREPRWLAPAAVGVAVLLTLVLTALPIRLAGAAPVAAFERYVITPLTTPNGTYRYTAADHSGLTTDYISINTVRSGAFVPTEYSKAKLATVGGR